MRRGFFFILVSYTICLICFRNVVLYHIKRSEWDLFMSVFSWGSAHAAKETSATPLELDKAREHESRRGISSASPHFPQQPCFAFGLDTETEINDGHTFSFFFSHLRTQNKLSCLSWGSRVFNLAAGLRGDRPSKLTGNICFRILTLLTCCSPSLSHTHSDFLQDDMTGPELAL